MPYEPQGGVIKIGWCRTTAGRPLGRPIPPSVVTLMHALAVSMSSTVARRLRRTVANARRLVDYARTPELHPRCKLVEAFWWTSIRNFGDELGPWILSKYGIASVLRQPEHAQLVSVGSILHTLPQTFHGLIWGSGSINGHPTNLPRATVLALRGELTKAALGPSRAVVLGDPALLTSRHVDQPPTTTTLGIVAHYAHRRSAAFRALQKKNPGDVRIIDVQRRPAEVVKDIAACQSVLTSSLHGLIIADSFGIPAGWVIEEPTLTGGDFKFRDHESVVSPERSRRLACYEGASLSSLLKLLKPADEQCVGASIASLDGSAQMLAGRLKRSVAPRTVWMHQLRPHVAEG